MAKKAAKKATLKGENVLAMLKSIGEVLGVRIAANSTHVTFEFSNLDVSPSNLEGPYLTIRSGRRLVVYD